MLIEENIEGGRRWCRDDCDGVQGGAAVHDDEGRRRVEDDDDGSARGAESRKHEMIKYRNKQWMRTIFYVPHPPLRRKIK